MQLFYLTLELGVETSLKICFSLGKLDCFIAILKVNSKSLGTLDPNSQELPKTIVSDTLIPFGTRSLEDRTTKASKTPTSKHRSILEWKFLVIWI